MRKILAALVTIFFCAPVARAHITPNVELVRKGEFLKSSLPDATRFFERGLMISLPDGQEILKETGWSPSDEDTKVYVGRDENGRLVGSVVFLWVASQHGPVGIAAVFDPQGTLRRAAVTDVGSEPLAWVRPLVERGGLDVLAGLAPGTRLDAARIAPAATGSMSRYYARVIAEGILRAQAIERLSRRRGEK
jgi:hypothetical protein